MFSALIWACMYAYVVFEGILVVDPTHLFDGLYTSSVMHIHLRARFTKIEMLY
jgi:hypothetical protein